MQARRLDSVDKLSPTLTAPHTYESYTEPPKPHVALLAYSPGRLWQSGLCRSSLACSPLRRISPPLRGAPGRRGSCAQVSEVHPNPTPSPPESPPDEIGGSGHISHSCPKVFVSQDIFRILLRKMIIPLTFMATATPTSHNSPLHFAGRPRGQRWHTRRA